MSTVAAESVKTQFDDKRWLLLLLLILAVRPRRGIVVKPVQVRMFAPFEQGRQAASRVSVVSVDDGAEGEARHSLGCACEEPTRECAGRDQGTCWVPFARKGSAQMECTVDPICWWRECGKCFE